MANQFDEFSKRLSERHSRRGLLKFFGAGVVGAAFSTIFTRDVDARGRQRILDACYGLEGEDFLICAKNVVCTNVGGEPCGKGPEAICCPHGTKCVAVNSTYTVSLNGTEIYGEMRCVPIRQSSPIHTRTPFFFNGFTSNR